MHFLSPAVCVVCVVALLAGFLLCRALGCARVPALLGAAAWALSDPVLRPDALLIASSRGLPVPSLLLPFALTGAFGRARARWPLLGLALSCAVLRWRSSAGTAHPAFGALDALVLAGLAALGAQRLWDGEGGAAFLLGAVGAAIVVVRSALHAPEIGTAAISVVPVAVAIVLVALLSRERRARAGLVALCALFGIERALEIGGAAKGAAGPAAAPSGLATAAAATPGQR